MDGSDFQTLGAASILTKKVAAKKRRPQEEWNGYRIFEAAKQGDTVCLKAIDEMTDVLGKGIANICYVLNIKMMRECWEHIIIFRNNLGRGVFKNTPSQIAIFRTFVRNICSDILLSLY